MDHLKVFIEFVEQYFLFLYYFGVFGHVCGSLLLDQASKPYSLYWKASSSQGTERGSSHEQDLNVGS